MPQHYNTSIIEIKREIADIIIATGELESQTVHTRIRSNAQGNCSTNFSLYGEDGTFDRINGCEIEIIQDLTEILMLNKSWTHQTTVRIKMYYGHDDVGDSEQDFREILEIVKIAINSNHNLNSTIVSHAGIQEVAYGFEALGEYVVHSSELQLSCRWVEVI